MLSHRPNLSVRLITCGEPTEKAALTSVCREIGGLDFDIIRDVSPQSAAANMALSSCSTEYLVVVDSDMVLYRGWLGRVRDKIDELGDDRGWYQVLFNLYDTLTAVPILALKLQRPGLCLPLSDVRIPDWDHYNRMRVERPWLRVIGPMGEPVGDHVVLGSRACYLRYKDLALGLRLYDPGRAVAICSEHYQLLLHRFRETGSSDFEFAVAGLVDGLRFDDCGSKRWDEVMRVDVSGALAEFTKCSV